jgi:hypothetical protein
MAVGVDIGFISLEIGELLACQATRKQITCYTRPAIIGTMLASAGMNAYAFSMHAPNLAAQIAGAAFGMAIPGLIWCIARVASIMAMRD